MDDVFSGFPDFQSQFDFLRNHFLPRVDWTRARLAFKKLKLFEEKIVALGVNHHIGGLVTIIPQRVKKIIEFPKPQVASDVKSFLGTVSITRRWVRNFAELARPLSGLTGKVDWRWGGTEELSFEILKVSVLQRRPCME